MLITKFYFSLYELKKEAGRVQLDRMNSLLEVLCWSGFVDTCESWKGRLEGCLLSLLDSECGHVTPTLHTSPKTALSTAILCFFVFFFFLFSFIDNGTSEVYGRCEFLHARCCCFLFFFKSVATATSISYDCRLSEVRSSLWTQLGRPVMDMSSDQQCGLSGQLCDVYL